MLGYFFYVVFFFLGGYLEIVLHTADPYKDSSALSIWRIVSLENVYLFGIWK